MKLITLFSFILLLSGCSAMSIEECKVAHWEDVGYNDASRGYDKLRFARYTKACAKGNIIPNQSRYDTGYDAGLKLYCTPQNIFDRGLYGSGNYTICPADEHSYLKPYSDVSYAYYKANDEKKSLIKEIDRYEKLLENKDIKEDLKKSYKSSLSSLENKRGRIMRNFYDAEDRMERFKRAKNLDSW